MCLSLRFLVKNISRIMRILSEVEKKFIIFERNAFKTIMRKETFDAGIKYADLREKKKKS